MFGKILIANRGEIAVRIIRTARLMGIATVAVYCDSDRDAPHVETADEAVNIGPPPATSSYLRIERILDACRQTGAEAVHPGYGFLSEQTPFVEALDADGIVFIGPNARAIAAMGDKIQSKKIAAEAGVATVPGHPGTIDSAEDAIAVARGLGLPVMIKASAGGGGKGMRIARTLDAAREGYARARSEAASSFGDDRVFIEKFIEKPRHIEIQVLADKYGNVVHLGERECSIQRRHQKIIEEAPSPAVDDRLRKSMGEQAVALAKAVGYDSAGTVEFVFGDGQFYFLEMNTRLQVEHPVTELITGTDLVEQMIRSAAGERLTLSQGDIRFNGWAIETRLYAEDPYRDFLPSIGRLNIFQTPPEQSENDKTLRIDSGVVEGSEVTIYFDPLLAKLVTHGPDRAAAIDIMADVLDRTVVEGLSHNQPFLSALMDHPRWRRGDLTTAFIDEEFSGGFGPAKPEANLTHRLAIVALDIELKRRKRLQKLAGRSPAKSLAAPEDWAIVIDDVTIALEVPKVRVRSDWRPGERVWSGLVEGEPLVVQVRLASGGLRLSRRGVDVLARVMRPRVAKLAALMPEKRTADTAKLVRCPMPGLVVTVNVVVGQAIRAGEPVAIVEAMKMENILRAERDAVVSAVNVEAGEVVAVDTVIVEFE
jgi:propionyl-CoA carboxylase alpha subunit